MKNIRILSPIIPLGLLLCLQALNLQSSCLAQGTAFTYQGRLNDGATLANGNYDLRFTIFDASTSGSAIAGPVTNAATSLSNGLFTVTLDFGGGVFDGSARWLEIGVRTNGNAFTTLAPRQQLTATPYAITAGDVTGANIARLTVPNTAVQATGHPIVTSGFVTSAVVDNPGSGYLTAPPVLVLGTGSGAAVTSSISNGTVVSMTVQNAGSGYSNSTTLLIGTPPSNAAQTFASSNYFSGVNMLTNPLNVISGDGSGLTGVWRTDGNTSVKIPTTDFVGRLDNQPLTFRVNNQRALVLAPTTNGPNFIAGFSNNAVGIGVTSATIGGGGQFGYPNQIGATFGTIAGGRANLIQTAIGSTIGGGEFNEIDANLNSSTISGGFQNSITGTAPLGGGSAIGGGVNNIIGAPRGIGGVFIGQAGTIGGGFYNVITTNAFLSTIGGGQQNLIDASSGSTIAGGDGNWIGTANSADSTIGGGVGNTIGGPQSSTIALNGANTIGGGNRNAIGTNANWSTIAGGSANIIGTNASNATIAGGSGNTIAPNSAAATIPGGDANTATNNAFAAGHRAKANHTGAFVWADFQNADFASTGTNQFLVRASGGVGIGTTSPQGELHVNGNTVLQGLVAPSAVAATNLLNIGSGVTADGFRNGISFYEGATASAMSFGYDGVGGASQNALRIYHTSGSPLFTFQANGNLGIGTTNPLTVLHAMDAGDAQISIQSGDTGGHRWALQSSGVSGNIALDASFQIVDRTLNKPRLFIGTNGSVGLGTTFSDVPLTIRATGAATEWLTLTSTSDTPRWQLNEFGGGLNFAQSSVTDGRLFLANNGNTGIGTLTPTNKLHVAGGVSATAFVNTSDRNAKENFQPVNPREVLDKVSAMPISTWNYKQMRDGRHMGPVAQDFYAAFGLGGSDKTITTVDPDGVALAAIQGLNEKLEAENHTSEARIRKLEAENADLKQRLEKLELLVSLQNTPAK